MDSSVLQKVDTIVHLAGAGVADERWTTARKDEILQSRTHSTRLLFDALSNHKHTVKTFVSASAIGYYGFNNPNEIFTEESEPGNDFLAGVTRKWEYEVDRLNNLSLRVVKLRIGIVLSEKGGALKEMSNPVKFFAGAPLGTGNQFMSWVHIDDLCRMFMRAIDDETMQGAFNAVAPNPVTNRVLTKSIGQVLGKPIILPAVPAFALKFVLGEMAQIVVSGNQVSSKKIEKKGFKFKFPELAPALNDLLQKR